MKPKQLFTILLLLIVTSIAFAQNENAFASIGKKGKVLTLTKGQYNETFDADSIQQIGSSLINIRTMKVVNLLTDEESKKRLEGEKHSRFLSVDPITSSYPMLTPYQYASNRPIDGIDMDGLEYVTYTVTIGLGGKKGSTIMSKEAVWFNANQHNAHGNLGRGVLYKIKFIDARNNKPNGGYNMFVSRNDGALWGAVIKEYGNYMGATGLYKVANDGLGFTKEYEYDISPVDQVDNLAYAHDKGYDALSAVGKKSLFGDWGTTPVDEAALNGWNSFLDNSPVGSADPFNGQKVTQTERNAAWQGAQLFDIVVSNKKGDISIWMQRNYKGEAANHTNKGMYGAKDMQANYNLFLNKYMEKGKDGNWVRKAGMWNEDKDHNFTPKTPEQLKTP